MSTSKQFDSYVEKIQKMVITSFPCKKANYIIARSAYGNCVLGTTLNGLNKGVFYSNDRFSNQKTFFDYKQQRDRQFDQVLECLMMLGYITREERDLHMSGMRAAEKREKIKECKREIEMMSYNEVFIEYLRSIQDKIPEMLLSNDENEKRFAKMIVIFRGQA